MYFSVFFANILYFCCFMNTIVDINENNIQKRDPEILRILLFDNTTKQNIFWATNDYADLGERFGYNCPILPELVTGEYVKIIRPRTLKARELQTARSREMAEVFTPAWVCNAQNNLIDEAWFGKKDVFNTELENHTWKSTTEPIQFPDGKSWKDYVRDTRLEITCGEAPYITSRYDATTGEPIEIPQRIGILDRKLRVVSENTDTSGAWLDWAQEAFKNVYAYEWQGDNLLLAREAMLYTFIDCYRAKFGKEPQKQSILAIARIIAWNVWQMDGLKCVVPDSCHETESNQLGLFEDEPTKIIKRCKGCEDDNIWKHNGTYCIIKDWDADKKKGKEIRFVDLIAKL